MIDLSKLDPTRIQDELCRRSLRAFSKAFFPVIEPGTELQWGWSQDAVVEHLEAVSRGQIRRLIINIPPRSLKSSLVSVLWPAWTWLSRPESRWFTSSYNLDLSIRDAVKTRRLMLSDPYRRIVNTGNPRLRWDFLPDNNLKQSYENNFTGTRIATAVGAAGTGQGGQFLIVDDAHSADDVGSEAALREACEWFDGTFFTRQNDLRTSSIVVVGQRISEGDLTDHLITKGFEILCLPMEYERNHPNPTHTSLGWRDPRTKEGELLYPERIGPVQVEELKMQLGPYKYAAQYQQRPSPAKGLMFGKDQFKRWSNMPVKVDLVLQSWDLTFRGAEDARTKQAEVRAVVDPAFVVGSVFGFKGAEAYLLDEERGQWDIIQAMEAIRRMTKKWPAARMKLIENKANGPAVEQMLRKEIPGIILVNPEGSKIERARACVPYVAAGNVWVPLKAPWVDDWLAEICSFPTGRFKDRVDTFSMACLYGLGPQQKSAVDRLRRMTAGL